MGKAGTPTDDERIDAAARLAATCAPIAEQAEAAAVTPDTVRDWHHAESAPARRFRATRDRLLASIAEAHVAAYTAGLTVAIETLVTAAGQGDVSAAGELFRKAGAGLANRVHPTVTEVRVAQALDADTRRFLADRAAAHPDAAGALALELLGDLNDGDDGVAR